MGTVVTYSRKAHGEQSLSANFRVREFACKDGSDKILVDTDLVALLQKIRDHFGAAVTINSAYRTPAHNKTVGGATGSQHVKGTAADIVVAGAAPLEVAQYAEYLLPESGGIGVYQSFTHVDVRSKRSRWDNRSGREVVVSGWPGYVPPAAPADRRYNTVDECPDWARETVQKLLDKKYLDGEGGSVDVGPAMVRLRVTRAGAGCYRKKRAEAAAMRRPLRI